MKVSTRRTSSAIALLGMALLASGCAKVKGYQGYVADQVLMDGVQAGIDNRASVEKTLGRPSFVGQFDTADWYYVSRQTRQYQFNNPKPKEQTVLRIRFDQAGNVVAVDKAGVDRVANIDPSSDKTKTLGKDRSFFEELFGNIGQVGSVGQSGGTADNPE